LPKIEAANEQSLHKILQGEPVIIDIQPAADVVEALARVSSCMLVRRLLRIACAIQCAGRSVELQYSKAGPTILKRPRRQLQTAALHFTRIIISRALPLRCGLEKIYAWIESQVANR
jgi:hypothetical protein